MDYLNIDTSTILSIINENKKVVYNRLSILTSVKKYCCYMMTEFIVNDEYTFTYRTDKEVLDDIAENITELVKKTSVKTIVRNKHETMIYLIPSNILYGPCVIKFPKRHIDIYDKLKELIDSLMQDEIKQYGKTVDVLKSKVLTVETN